MTESIILSAIVFMFAFAGGYVFGKREGMEVKNGYKPDRDDWMELEKYKWDSALRNAPPIRFDEEEDDGK